MLATLAPEGILATMPADRSQAEPELVVQWTSPEKRSIFVAMPFAEEFDDIFHYGIKAPIHQLGYLCERADELSYTGTVMDVVKQRIEAAELVVADVTGSNPNVFLEIGYAWGIGKPTVLLANQPDGLSFDVRGEKCLVYKNIKTLEGLLSTELDQLLSQ
jgi:hypothetical protein